MVEQGRPIQELWEMSEEEASKYTYRPQETHSYSGRGLTIGKPKKRKAKSKPFITYRKGSTKKGLKKIGSLLRRL